MKKFILTLLSLLTIPAHAHALSCMQPDFSRAAQGADSVFIGQVTKIEVFEGQENMNKVTAKVLKPYKNAQAGEIVTIYQKHWLNPQEPWQESNSDKRAGIFTLRHLDPNIDYTGIAKGEDAYHVGMCRSLYWPKTEEHMKILQSVYSE